ncbi:MAG: porin [Deltaproteobacteria bacterium]|nr:porin [Deltaproteobacteria bacterium]
MSRTFRIAFFAGLAGLGFLAVLGTAAPAQAADPAMAELLKILRERGSLTEAEYEALSGSAPATPPVSAAPEAEQADAGTGGGGPDADADTKPVEEKVEEHDARIEKAEKAIEEQKTSFLRIKEITDGTSSDLIGKALEGKWYERLSFGGYTQFRIGEVLSQTGPDLEVPNDRSVRDNEVFTIRRGRLKVSGDVSEHLFLYMQTEFNASIGGDQTTLQMRDLYADIALDSKQEWRLRFGESKVPFGFVNLQSSQNRTVLERSDALNSAVENERDFGAYVMWAPQEVRKRFKDLIKNGLKGSGDYGVVAFGAYGGQGPNTSDDNSQPHVAGRVSYPFAFDNGQIVELGAQYYWGRFVADRSEIDLGGGPVTPDQPSNGANDHRGALSFILYPQPFGFDAEWTVGEGPELSPDGSRIEARFLHGGYVQASYRQVSTVGDWIPFLRWNYYAGGRKFATNAPRETVNELDAGLEYAPLKEIELVLSYTHSFERTNTRSAPYDDTKNAHRIGAQVQWNY